MRESPVRKQVTYWDGLLLIPHVAPSPTLFCPPVWPSHRMSFRPAGLSRFLHCTCPSSDLVHVGRAERAKLGLGYPWVKMSVVDRAASLSHRPYLPQPPARLPSDQRGRGGTVFLRVDVVSYGCSRSSRCLSVLIFSFVLAHFVIGLVSTDRTESVPFAVLETRWEELHAGKGVASSGQGSNTLCGTTGQEVKGQTGCIGAMIGDKRILTFNVSNMFF